MRMLSASVRFIEAEGPPAPGLLTEVIMPTPRPPEPGKRVSGGWKTKPLLGRFKTQTSPQLPQVQETFKTIQPIEQWVDSIYSLLDWQNNLLYLLDTANDENSNKGLSLTIDGDPKMFKTFIKGKQGTQFFLRRREMILSLGCKILSFPKTFFSICWKNDSLCLQFGTVQEF